MRSKSELDNVDRQHSSLGSFQVNTVKRTCFKTLPSILVIQLKRFDYDWEHETPIKFNDYFEFPRELDMEPYTVQGLAKAEGQLEEKKKRKLWTDRFSGTTVDDELNDVEQNGTKYSLSGIIVHMGQANGGHYYSYIKNKLKTISIDWIREKKTKTLFSYRISDNKSILNGSDLTTQKSLIVAWTMTKNFDLNALAAITHRRFLTLIYRKSCFV